MGFSKKVSILLEGKETVSDAAKKSKESLEGLGEKGESAFSKVGAAAIVANQAMELIGRTVGQAIAKFNELMDIYAVQEQAEARLEQIIRATGQAAGFTADQLFGVAGSLQSVTTFGDQAIIGMQSILATFRSIQGDVFERTTQAALDLSAAFGQDLKSSAIQLGKALEDPTTGLTALARIGVSFSQEQKAMITAMQEAGDVAGAQGIILGVLEQQVGGVAQAMAETTTGSLAQFKNLMGDAREQIGGLLAEGMRPMLEPLKEIVTNFTAWVSQMREAKAEANNLREALAGVGSEFVAGDTSLSYLERQIQFYQGVIETQRSASNEAANAINTARAALAQAEVLAAQYGGRMREALAYAQEAYAQAVQNATKQGENLGNLQRRLFDLQAQFEAQVELDAEHARLAELAAAHAKAEAEQRERALRVEETLDRINRNAWNRTISQPGYGGYGTGYMNQPPAAASFDSSGLYAGAQRMFALLGGRMSDYVTQATDALERFWPAVDDAKRSAADFSAKLDKFVGIIPGGGQPDYGQDMGYDPGTYIEQFAYQAEGAAYVMEELTGAMMGAVSQIGALGALLNPINTLMQGYLMIVGRLIHNGLTPLAGIVIETGKLIGHLLAPWIQIASAAIEILAKGFVWFYNHVILIIGNVIISAMNIIQMAVWGISQMIVNVMNTIIGWINFLIPGTNNDIALRTNPFGTSPNDINTGWLQPISLDTLNQNVEDLGYDYGGPTGSDNTTVNRPPDIYFYQTFNGPIIGENGMAELGRLIADSLMEYTNIGGNVNVIIGAGT